MPMKPPTVQDKADAWDQAFLRISSQLTPAPMRGIIDTITAGGQQAATDGNVNAYAALVSSAMQMARIVAANDRAAAIAAAMLTQSGISRPIVDVGVAEGDEA